MRCLDSNASDGEELPDVTVIQTALCYLMTRYASRPCAGLIITIVHHLRMLLAHPDIASQPEDRRKIHRELLRQWQAMAEQQQKTDAHRVRSQQVVWH
ncbi:MAG TPA: hypothetical protein PKI41_14900 [Candidatus Competibacteraceae bacterium]|nr:hypothetical protein [Candidatus Competibacteraceae bacterium]HQA26608.1 hypothetical protein [Candidatus Competibacteraceae bacterium]HQD56498.1 hypothetical protein [Candidatus Competibacteraceae bacterium]